MNQLLKTNDSSELELIAEKARESFIIENDSLYQLLADEANKSPSLMARLFPSELEREKQALTVQRVRSLVGKKEQLMDVYFKVKLEIARQEGEALIQTTGVHLRTELAKFVTAKIDEMDTAILTSRQIMMAKMQPHIDAIEKYQNYPMLYEPAKKSIENQIVSYMDTIDELLNGFRDSLKAGTTRIHSSF